LIFLVLYDTTHQLNSLLLQSSTDPRDLHSFPTRRSSDLRGRLTQRTRCQMPMTTWQPTRRRRSGALDSRSWLRLEPLGFQPQSIDRKSTRLNSSHVSISYAVFCLKKKKNRVFESTLNACH